MLVADVAVDVPETTSTLCALLTLVATSTLCALLTLVATFETTEALEEAPVTVVAVVVVAAAAVVVLLLVPLVAEAPP